MMKEPMHLEGSYFVRIAARQYVGRYIPRILAYLLHIEAGSASSLEVAFYIGAKQLL